MLIMFKSFSVNFFSLGMCQIFNGVNQSKLTEIWKYATFFLDGEGVVTGNYEGIWYLHSFQNYGEKWSLFEKKNTCDGSFWTYTAPKMIQVQWMSSTAIPNKQSEKNMN
jgi:hypothetical protein